MEDIEALSLIHKGYYSYLRDEWFWVVSGLLFEFAVE